MSDAILKTKWGNAKVDNHGYYQITSAKYGKNGERLHRVIFEDFYGEIPKGYSEEGKQKAITSVSLEKLEKKVKARGLKWLKLEMEA